MEVQSPFCHDPRHYIFSRCGNKRLTHNTTPSHSLPCLPCLPDCLEVEAMKRCQYWWPDVQRDALRSIFYRSNARTDDYQYPFPRQKHSTSEKMRYQICEVSLEYSTYHEKLTTNSEHIYWYGAYAKLYYANQPKNFCYKLYSKFSKF